MALVVVAASTVLWFAGEGVPIGIVGWVMAGPVAVGLFAVYLSMDSRRRSAAWYTPSAVAAPLRILVLLGALAAVAMHAYHVADAVSRSSI